MMLLLDTCTFLWATLDAPDLSQEARSAFADGENDVYLSAVSTWEIAVKFRLGKLPLPQSPDRFVPIQRKQHRIEPLPLDEDATLLLPRLPDLHRDPFDRMLICQAIASELTILTPDPLVQQYPVRCLW